jgi:hypothetical protein
MPAAEMHFALDELTWEEVEALAEQDATVKLHIRKCGECQNRGSKVDEGRLASMGASKRKLILSAAQRLASLLRKEHLPN